MWILDLDRKKSAWRCPHAGALPFGGRFRDPMRPMDAALRVTPPLRRTEQLPGAANSVS